MDTSAEYIEMCTKSDSLQNILREWDDGDFLAYHNEYGYEREADVAFICDSDPYYQRPDPKCKVRPTWLPRQDQLQEIVIGRVFDSAQDLMRWAYSFLDTIYQQYPYNSIEQFWLMFIMKEKFNKEWNGSEWK